MRKIAVYKDEQTKGQWKARFRLDGKDYQKRGFKTKKEAVTWEAQKRLEAKKGEGMLFDTLCSEYLIAQKPRVQKTTYESTKQAIDGHLLPFFKGKKIDAITVEDIITWQNQLMDSKAAYKASYLRSLQARLSAIFNWGSKVYGITSPLRYAPPMGSKKRTKKLDIWTIEDLTKALSYLDRRNPLDDSFYLFLSLAFFTGLRRGELLALTLDDFKEQGLGSDRPVVVVSKSLKKAGGVEYIGSPKTPASRREVAISDSLYQEVTQYTQRLYNYQPNERLFPFYLGSPGRKLKKLVKRAGLPEITPHGLRHSCASMLINSGADPKQVQQFLGHENITETLDTYSHLYEGRQHELVDIMSKEYEKSTKRSKKTR